MQPNEQESSIAIAEAELQNSPLYVHRRERVKKQLEQLKLNREG